MPYISSQREIVGTGITTAISRMKTSILFLTLAACVASVLSSEGILPPSYTTEFKAPAYHQYQHEEYDSQKKVVPGSYVSVHSKVTPPQTGPSVTVTKNTYGHGQEKPVSWEQPTVNIQYQHETKVHTPVVHHFEQTFTSGHNVHVSGEKVQHTGSYSSGGSRYNQKETVTTYNSCSPPTNAHVLNVNWDASVSKGTWYFPLIHKTDLSNYNRFVYNRELRTNENVDSLCLRNEWDWRRSYIVFLGHGNEDSSTISCKKVGNTFEAECSSPNGENFKFYAVKSDNKNYVLAYTCWASGEVGWTFLSNTPKISYDLKQEIKAEVRSLGFNAFDTKEITYTACSGQEQTQIKTGHSTYVTETKVQTPIVHHFEHTFTSGHNVRVTDEKVKASTYVSGSHGYAHETVTKYSTCSPPTNAKVLNVNWDASISKGTWYFPLIHKTDLSNYNKLVYNRELRSNENTDNLCLRNEWDWRRASIVFLGRVNNDASTITCNKVGNTFEAECTSPNGENFKFYAVKSDNKNYVLAYTCWASGEIGWTFLSNTPTVAYQLKQEINSEVRSLGFNSFDTKEISYAACSVQEQTNVKTGHSIRVTDTNVHQTANHFGQRPVGHAFTQTTQQKVQQPTQHYVSEQKIVETQRVEAEYATCKPPATYHLAELSWRSDKEFLYLPLIHNNDLSNFHRIVFGTDLRSYQNTDSLCLHNNWSVHNRQYNIFSDAGKTSQPISCNQIGTKWAYECNTPQGNNAFRTYTVKSDNKNWALTYNCWVSGVTGWTLYADTPTISYTTKEEVLRKVRELGFKADDYNEVKYDNCFQDEAKTTTFGRPTSTFTSTIHQTKPAVVVSKTTEEHRYTHQQQTPQITTTFVQKPVVHHETTTFNRKPVVEQTTYVQKPAVVDQTTYEHKPVVHQTTYVQKPVLEQHTTTFDRKPVVHHETTFVQKQPASHHTTTTFTQTQKQTSYGSFTGQQQQKYTTQHQTGGSIRTKYQHCDIPPKSQLAESPLTEFVGVRENTQAPLQQQYFYYPLTQTTTLNQFNKLIFGRELYTNEDVNALCYGNVFAWTGKDNDITGTFLSKTTRNNRSSEVVTCRQEDKSKWFGECTSRTGESFIAYVVKDDFKHGGAHGFIGNLCWESGQSAWNFFSTERTVSAEDKDVVLKEVARLGYDPSDYVQVSYDKCPVDYTEEHQQARFFNKNAPAHSYESEYESTAEGSATAYFPNCRAPQKYLRTFDWESSSYFEGVEYFDYPLMHIDVPVQFNKILNYKKSFNLRRDKDSTCFKNRFDWKDNGVKIIGYGDQVSTDPIKCYQQGSESIWKCISKTGNSFKDYGISTDPTSWMLYYTCWESGVQTWTVEAKPGTVLSENVKKSILAEVKSLGFNPTEYIQPEYERCTFNHNLFSAYTRSCDCCRA